MQKCSVKSMAQALVVMAAKLVVADRLAGA